MFKKVVSLCLSVAVAFSMGSTVAKAEASMPEDVCANHCKHFSEVRENIFGVSEELDLERAKLDKKNTFYKYIVKPVFNLMEFLAIVPKVMRIMVEELATRHNRPDLLPPEPEIPEVPTVIIAEFVKWFFSRKLAGQEKRLDEKEEKINKRLEKLKKNEQYLKSRNCFCDEFEQENI